MMMTKNILNKKVMKRILVPSDFSPSSEEALKFGLALAARTKGEVIVMHSVNIPSLYDLSAASGGMFGYEPDFVEEIEGVAEREFGKVKEKLGSQVNMRLEVMHGDIIEGIRRIHTANPVDVAIVGASGVTSMQEIFIGSNTEKIVRNSPVPVFVIRQAPPIDKIKNILLPTSLEGDQENFMKVVATLQAFFNATLHILLVNTPNNFISELMARKALNEFVLHHRLNNYKLYFKSYITEEDGIIEFATSEKMDLIAMGTHARKGLAHLFNGSITEDVVTRIHCPVWTCALR
jgi:nucleotide-binding universal stress UspA family protein